MNHKKNPNQKDAQNHLNSPGEPGEELTPREILAYHEGQFSEEEENHFLERLAHDPSAVKDLLEMDQFPNQVEAPAMTPGELDTAWQSFQQKVEKPGDPVPNRVSRVTRSTHPIITTLAACFLLVIGGLCYWIVDLKKTNQALLSPSLDAGLADVYMDGIIQRSNSGSSIPTLESFEMIFILHLPETQGELNAYEVEIQNPSGQTLFPPVKKKTQKKLNLRLLRDAFPDLGIHEITVYKMENGQRVFIKSSKFMVQ